MYIHNLSPILFDFGFFEIKWYSIAYIIGILAGWWLGKKIILQNKNFKEIISLDEFDNYISYLIVGIILGGRFGYIIFYNFFFYLENPLNIFKIWQGGMSFHGAVLGVILVTYIFVIKKKIQPLFLLDIVACVTPIGLFFGRVANFINSELYGTETNLPWAVKFVQVDNLFRHPSQLYEAFLEGLVLFIVLLYFKSKGHTKVPGIASGLFLFFYSIFRFIVEFLRVPDEQLGYLFLNLTMGQLISFVFLLIGIYLIITKYEIKKE